MDSYLKHKERLRKRYDKNGLDGFHDYEVLEMMLSYSIIRKDTKPIAKALIKHFGSLTNVINAPIELLCTIEGVGHRTAVLIKLFKDVASFHLRENIIEKPFIRNIKEMTDYLTHHFKGKAYEEFKVIYLNASLMIIHEETLAKGISNQTNIYLKQLVQNVIHYNASLVIVVHNHPAGSVEPSDSDIRLTKNIKYALNLIDVKLMDHIIVGQNKYLSMANEGYLDL